MERVTALLAQAAATILVLIGLVVVLGYTHSRAYDAGYCSGQYCPQTDEGGWWPFGNDRRPTATTPTATRPGAVTPPGRATTSYPDPPPNVRPGSTDYGGGSAPGGLNVSTGVAGPGSSTQARPITRPPVFTRDPGERICTPDSRDVGDGAIARCWLRVGDAYQAVDRIDEARSAWDEALLIGSSVGGAQASLVAHQRLQAAVLERSCPTTPQSLARIAYGFDQTEDDGDIIELALRQRALAALGYYNGEVDGNYGPMTRRSVRDFQGDLGFDLTGVLTPAETVTLVCHAALTARDAHAQNLLGIMFATGLGLEQNIDTSLEWLETAAERGHAGANFNLAVMYGTGTVQGSYRLCGIVESPERADSYLRRAADLGHDRARRLRSVVGVNGEPGARWTRISQALIDEAEQNGDRFYLAWQRRVDEMRRLNGNELHQPGCYQAAMDGAPPAAD
ncbi:peptidoglycan-binding protein [Maricaulis sp.]|uniref:peptidoglycan-binding protein n=1 Tax=Maricaulis sp. TaxID=1486257 RepID=UPI002B266245|nr:peptidoglycan-binding protein [Maricaulis sp.]